LSVLIAVIYGMSAVCFAQNVGNDEASLRGKWIYEGITAFEGNVQQAFSPDDLCCEFPSVMDIRQDEIDCVWKYGQGTAKYDSVVRGNGMCLLICTEWKIVDNKLQLTWTYDVEGDTPRVFNMTVTYKLS
jgi:hypothetical protein